MMRMQSQWLGKCAGSVLGLLLTQHFAGILIGLFLGHAFDLYRTQAQLLDDAVRLRKGWKTDRSKNENLQRGFMQTLFFLLGKLAKCDGRVCEKEIAWVEQLMRRLYLSQSQRQEAIGWFNQGKTSEAEYETLLRDFARFAVPFGLNALFLELMVECALCDSELSAEERVLLGACAKGLKLPQWRLEEYILRFSSTGGGSSQSSSGKTKGPAWAGMWGDTETTYESSNTGGQRRYSTGSSTQQDSLAAASRRLGVSTVASRSELKRAYRKLMSQHHPDKLISRGAPEAMLTLAKEKTQSIQKDYETVCRLRGFK